MKVGIQYLSVCLTLLAFPYMLEAQERGQPELARLADSVRTAYADSVTRAGASSGPPFTLELLMPGYNAVREGKKQP